MKENINICYCINKNHVDLTLKSISYIRKFFKNQKYKLKFFICSTDIFKLPNDLNYINIQSDLNIIHQHCMLPDFINVDRMIYLDSDTIAMTCISKLWEIDIGNKIITIDGRWNHCPVDKFKKVYISHFYNHYSNLKKQHNLYH